MRDYFYRLMTDQDQSAVGWIAKWMLCGFSLLYRVGIQTILWFYKIGFLKKTRLSKPVVSIGNITWGGTGKTPLVEWLVKYLKEKKIKPVVLIRGYMVKNSVILPAPVIVTGGPGRPKAEAMPAGRQESHHQSTWDSSALSGLQNDTSDEAQVLHQSFPDVPVLVGKDRIENARQALEKYPIDVFVLDDGFQHWKLHRDLEIVVIDAMNPFGNGCLIPRGILREPLKSLKRADLFVLTKTDWGQENIEAIKKHLYLINPGIPIVETVHRAMALVDLCDPAVEESVEFLKGKTVAAFCGIGGPESFRRLLESLGADVVVFKSFADHHAYDRKDLADLLDMCREKKVQTILTTQKDAVKLTQFLRHDGQKIQFLSVKMEIQIIKGYEELCGRISRLLDR